MNLIFSEKILENKKEFAEKVKDIAVDLNIDPNWLMLIMNNESGLNHRAKNSIGCVGLIQFCPNTGAKTVNATPQELLSMSNVKQLDYVQDYFEKVKGLSVYFNGYNSFAELYLAAYLPAYLNKPDSFVIPIKYSNANPLFDVNKDGKQTIGEFKQAVVNKYKDVYKYLEKEGNPYFINSQKFRFTRNRKKILLFILLICILIVFSIYLLNLYKRKPANNE